MERRFGGGGFWAVGGFARGERACCPRCLRGLLRLRGGVGPLGGGKAGGAGGGWMGWVGAV